MRSIQLATSGHASPMRCCLSLARARLTGATPSSRSSDRLLEAVWPAFCYGQLQSSALNTARISDLTLALEKGRLLDSSYRILIKS